LAPFPPANGTSARESSANPRTAAAEVAVAVAGAVIGSRLQQIPHRRGHRRKDVRELARGHVAPHDRHHRAHREGGLGLASKVGVVANAVQERARVPVVLWRPGGCPVLVEGAADQLGELAGELRALLDRAAIAQGMQDALEGALRRALVVVAELRGGLVDPVPRLLDAALQDGRLR